MLWHLCHTSRHHKCRSDSWHHDILALSWHCRDNLSWVSRAGVVSPGLTWEHWTAASCQHQTLGQYCEMSERTTMNHDRTGLAPNSDSYSILILITRLKLECLVLRVWQKLDRNILMICSLLFVWALNPNYSYCRKCTELIWIKTHATSHHYSQNYQCYF